MSDIFVSYALADQDRAEAVVKALREAGYATWWDRDIAPGAERGAALRAAMEDAKLCMILWSVASTDEMTGRDVMDEAEWARGQGRYLGVMIDDAALPFGFGGYDPVDVAPFRGDATGLARIVEGARQFMEVGQSGPAALPPPPPPPPPKTNVRLIAGIGAGAFLLVALIAWFVIASRQPSLGQIVEAKLNATPCAWLRVDPVRDGADGTMGLIGVAGDPATARKAVRDLIAAEGLPVNEVTIDKVAQIDPRECAAIDEPLRLRRSAGGRLRVTGEPFILDTALAKPQALSRVEIRLEPQDRSMALFGVEPNGEVTWILPTIETLDSLKDLDIGYVHPGDKHWEFNVYPDHLGWTGLFVVTGDGPLATTFPQGKVQKADEFAATLRKATASGNWDADMVWFKIDPKR